MLIQYFLRFVVRDKEYTFMITAAVCAECGSEVSVPGLADHNAQEIDKQYREEEGIVSIGDIQKLMDIYRIGKAPLSLALGFGEITVTRYLSGQIPSKEYSDIIRKALESPRYMLEKLQQNRERIGETAYQKSRKAAVELTALFSISGEMLATISYIFAHTTDVTPLALQKLLYFIQGIYLALYHKALYPEDCQAWVHGPAYESVYLLFKNFKYNPIEEPRFVMFRHRFHKLDPEALELIDNVLGSFGMYSGKVLEAITHRETPWVEARRGYLPEENSDEVITKSAMQQYFTQVAERFDIKTAEGLRAYAEDRWM